MKFNLTAHKELWNWLADNPDKEKYNWPGWKGNGGKYGIVKDLCFACQYSSDIMLQAITCKGCPFIEDYSYFNSCCLNGLYKKWLYERTSEFARQIANLPVREGVECE